LWNRYALFFIVVKMIEYLTSTFIISCSIFCGSKQIRKFEFVTTQVHSSMVYGSRLEVGGWRLEGDEIFTGQAGADFCYTP